MTDATLTLNNWESRYRQSEKELDKLIELCLKNCPRNLLIELLKKRKIISRDWEAKGNKFEVKG